MLADELKRCFPFGIEFVVQQLHNLPEEEVTFIFQNSHKSTLEWMKFKLPPRERKLISMLEMVLNMEKKPVSDINN